MLARDRVGKKPLYYMQAGDRFLFASEPKAILAALPRVPDMSMAALLEFLTFGYVGGRRRDFLGMSRLEPGSIARRSSRGGAPRRVALLDMAGAERASSCPSRNTSSGSPAELDEAVRIRLRSDVPLGAFLSGGLDSAAVLALMAKHSPRPVKTFSIGFGDPEYDELDAARATARSVRRRPSRVAGRRPTAFRSRSSLRLTTTNRLPTRRRFRPSSSPSSPGGT